MHLKKILKYCFKSCFSFFLKFFLALWFYQPYSPLLAATTFDCLIEPSQTVDVGSPVTGLLEKTLVKRGDTVVKGQLIASLESHVEAATAAVSLFKSEMQAPTQSAQSKIEFSQKKLDRRSDMLANKFMSQQEKDDAHADLMLAQAELKLASENKQLARLEWQQQNSVLQLRSIRSPFNGVVVDQLLFPGEILEPSGQKKIIYRLAKLDPLRVRVIFPMSVFGKINLDMPVEVFAELPLGRRYNAPVKVVDRLVDAASGSFSAYLELVNPKLEIAAGVKCRAQFPSNTDFLKK